MKLRLLGTFVFALSFASSLFAALPVEYKELPIENSNPTIKTCTAYRSLGQRCKSCIGSTRVDGTPEGRCTTSGYSDRCTCDSGMPSCRMQGECTYSNS